MYAHLKVLSQTELSNEYQHDMVSMVFKNLCILVHRTKAALVLKGLISTTTFILKTIGRGKPADIISGLLNIPNLSTQK